MEVHIEDVWPYISSDENVLFRDEITAGCLNKSHAFDNFRDRVLVCGADSNEVDDVGVKAIRLDLNQILNDYRHVHRLAQ